MPLTNRYPAYYSLARGGRVLIIHGVAVRLKDQRFLLHAP